MPSALIDYAGSDTTTSATLVAAPSSGHIRVEGYVLLADGTTTVSLADGASSVHLTGAYSLTAQAGIVAPATPDGWFDLQPTNALILNKTASIGIRGHVKYDIFGKT